MGIINETGAKLVLYDKEYRLLFTIGAIEKIEEETGESIDSLSDLLFIKSEKGKEKINFQNVAKIAHILVNESIDIASDKSGEKLEHIPIEIIKRMISNANIAECIHAIISAYNLSFLEDDNESPQMSGQS